MCLKRWLCMAVACVLFFGCINVPVEATEVEPATSESDVSMILNTRATGSFNMIIPANKTLSANSSFPLSAEETVTIKASFNPFSANLDVGLIAPDGNFYYFKVTDGIIDKTIQVSMSGDYTLQIRNNSGFEVELTGFVRY